MWVPATTDELEAAVRQRSVVETATLDFKAALPLAAKNHDLAVDVGAMTTEGGVLIYGVGEDEQEQPTVFAPIELAGARERVAQIAQSSIMPPPHIDIRALAASEDPARGYLVVAIPRSAVAPHMVITGNEYRYYGRNAAGNRILTEGEVALLYQRRDRWQLDRDQHLAEVVSDAMFPPSDKLIYAHAFVRPVATDDELVVRAARGADVRGLLHEAREHAGQFAAADRYTPDLRNASSIRRRGADGWLLHDGLHRREEAIPDEVVYARLDRDGTMRFFCGRVGDRNSSGYRLIFEGSIAGNTSVAFAIAGLVYERAGFVGEVDVGIAVTNLAGAISERVHRDGVWAGDGFGNEDYRRTGRILAGRLATDPRQVVSELCLQLFEITLPPGADAFDTTKR